MTTKHTPGPWYSQPTAGHETHGQSAIASEATGKTVAIAYDGKADARLLAAAPDLLEALQGYVAHIESCRAAWEEDGAERNTKMHGLAVALNNIFGDRIKEAIAKATGEPVMAA
jgi:hypothetical protein